MKKKWRWGAACTIEFLLPIEKKLPLRDPHFTGIYHPGVTPRKSMTTPSGSRPGPPSNRRGLSFGFIQKRMSRFKGAPHR
eukprot:scaffold280_cov391-Pavlova_lutheri.AAC.5